MRRLIVVGLFCFLLAGESLAQLATPLYEGSPSPHPGVTAFYTYMGLLGRHRFEEAFRYRVGVAREEFLQRVQDEWQDYEDLFARAGFTFLGWDVRAVDYWEDVGGNTYIRMIQTFRLRKGENLLLRHAGFLFRVTFRGNSIYTIDPIRGQILREEERPFPAGEGR
ncbi:MAG: hypothetical protein ACE5I9_08290 [Candidatus Methylomirabilales bacterium]